MNKLDFSSMVDCFTFKDKHGDNVNKANPQCLNPLSAVAVKISNQREPWGRKEGIRLWSWIRSFKIFVPITSKNTSSGEDFYNLYTYL
jgi:hypothetical protein